MATRLTAEKAKKMLKDQTIRGHRLTRKQQGLFGLIAGGGHPTRLSGHARRGTFTS